MKVEQLSIDAVTAYDLWKKYQSHKVHQTPADAEIEAIYKQIARGKTVIRALESIRNAGLGADGLPKLAIARADTASCFVQRAHDPAGAIFAHAANFSRGLRESKSKVVRVPWEGFNLPPGRWNYEATVPLIPVHLRPKRGLQNYHILWEAEWTKRYPVDPFLLRRFGGDAWLVVAAWDLTEVERAVMSSRLRS